MAFNHGLSVGDILTHEEIADVFKNNKQKGIKYSKETNTLVIISNRVETIYNDRWENGMFYYTGMGVEGNQKMERENSRIAQSKGIEVYLFEIFEPRKCTFIGEVQLIADPFQEEQIDINGNKRMVWMFPFRSLEEQSDMIIPKSIFINLEFHNEKKAEKLSYQEIQYRAITAPIHAGTRQSIVTHYERNLYVSQYAKRRSNGYCELCEQPAPFKNINGIPFLETHHIDWLSKGGEDTIQNTVALCPNCHRKMHILDQQEDVGILKEKAMSPT